MQIDELIKKSYSNSKEHGFWDEQQNFAEKLMLIVSELAEVLEEYRDNRDFNEIYYNEKKPDKPEGIPVELADVFIRLGDLCGGFSIDVEKAIKIKMKYNKGRPFKHGKKI